MAQPDRSAVVEALERVFASRVFGKADRSKALLRFLVERTLDGQSAVVKEYAVGVEALGRPSSFDPRTDPIVRAEASRLRGRLEHYYAGEGAADRIIIELPKGTYVPSITYRGTGPVPGERSAKATRAVWQERRRALGIALAVVVLGAVAWLRWSAGSRVPDKPVDQFEVELRSDGVLGSEVGTDVVISADGRRIAYVSRDRDSVAHLYTRRLEEEKSMRLEGTEGARGPFFSPDGRWIGFWAASKLKKIAVEGGAPVGLCDATDLLGASWVEDASIVAALGPTRKLWRIPAGGGLPEAVVDLTGSDTMPAWPQVLPGGDAVLYTAKGVRADSANIEVQTLSTGVRRTIVRNATFGRYLPNGYLTYVNQGTLYAVRFDRQRMTTLGAATPIITRLSYSSTFGYAQMDISATGTLVYRKGAEAEPSVVVWIDRDGRISPLLDTPGQYSWVRVAPDGHRIALAVLDGGTTALWIYDSRTRETLRLQAPSGEVTGPLWWPDGRYVVLGGSAALSWIDLEYPERRGSFKPGPGVQSPYSVSPDGRSLAYYAMDPVTGFDLWTVDVTKGETGLEAGVPQRWRGSAAFEVAPSYSPDGRWIAYASNASGTFEVYVSQVSGGEPFRVSVGGGSMPRWASPKGEVIYRTNDRAMIAPYRTTGHRFVVGTIRRWPAPALADTGVLPNFDVSPDGARLAALVPAGRPEDQQSRDHVTVLFNLFEEVQRRLANASKQ